MNLISLIFLVIYLDIGSSTIISKKYGNYVLE